MRICQFSTSVALFSTALLADPHFVSTHPSTTENGGLLVDFVEAGLGTDPITYFYTAEVTAVSQCFNKGGKHPHAANKESTEFEVLYFGDFQKPKNGRVQSSIVGDPPLLGALTCPPGQCPILAKITYANMVITDMRYGIFESVADVTFIEHNLKCP
jgi:hypothetical protein